MPTKLRATTPYWSTSATFTQFPKLAEDVVADVVVVGAGVTGLTAAYLLAKAGKRVVVLERDRCAGVDTGHTSAHLTMVTDARLGELVKRFGRNHAQAVWDAGLPRSPRSTRWSGSTPLTPAFEWVDGYLHAPPDDTDHNSEDLKADATLASELGFDAEYVETVPLIDRPGIRFTDQARIQPRALPGRRRQGIRRARRADLRALGSRRVLRRPARSQGQLATRCVAKTSSSPRTIRWSASAGSPAPRSFKRNSRCTPAT